MDLSRSIDFLLKNAGPVIKYRLRKEILRDLPQSEEDDFLARIYETPLFALLQTYVKPNGYIGRGMHSWDNWRGVKLHETPLQDGETAARLLSYYAIPKTHSICENFAAALKNDDILREEFSYIPPEIERFKTRRKGIGSGFSLQLLFDACLALMGFGDGGFIDETVKISFDAFQKILSIDGIEEITSFNPDSKRAYNYPYIEETALFPCVYHLQTLSHTQSWRNEKALKTLADSLNHLSHIMRDDTNIHVKIGGKYYAPLWALRNPIKPYERNRMDTCYRRVLTDIARMGIGNRVEVTAITAENVLRELRADGVLSIDFPGAYEKRRYMAARQYPTAYNELCLESDFKSDTGLQCDLTFWAVQFLTLYNGVD